MGIQWRMASLRSLFSAWAALPPPPSLFLQKFFIDSFYSNPSDCYEKEFNSPPFSGLHDKDSAEDAAHKPFSARFLLLLDFCARQNLSYCSPVVSPKSSKVLKWVWSVIVEDLKNDNSVLMPRMSLYPHCLILIGFKRPAPIGCSVCWFSCSFSYIVLSCGPSNRIQLFN